MGNTINSLEVIKFFKLLNFKIINKLIQYFYITRQQQMIKYKPEYIS